MPAKSKLPKPASGLSASANPPVAPGAEMTDIQETRIASLRADAESALFLADTLHPGGVGAPCVELSAEG